MKIIVTILWVILLTGSITCNAESASKDRQQIKAAKALIERVTPNYSKQFSLQIVPSAGNDTFGWSTQNGKVLLQGSNTIALAVAYYNYL